MARFLPTRAHAPARRCACAASGNSPASVADRKAAVPSMVRSSVVRRLHGEIASKKRSVLEITEEYLQLIHLREPALQSFITVTADEARKRAKQLDADLHSNGTASLSPLYGIPVGIKDTICTEGIRTTAGSRVLSGYTAPYNATAAARLKAAGAVLVGKCNCDAFAMGSTTESSDFQVTRNAWDLSRVPGGSSGGSAAAVAGGECVATLGSDTGGSIRQPASFCGVVGLKPTYGRVSRAGLIAYASSLDCIGPLAPTAEDAALVLSAIAGHDAADATSSRRSVPNFAAGLAPRDALASHPLAGRRLAVVREMGGKGVAPGVAAAVQKAVAHLEGLGADIGEVSLPAFELGLPAYYVLATSEASSNLARYDGVRYGVRQPGSDIRAMYDGTRGAGLNAEVKRRILMGTYALSAGYIDAFYTRAQQVRTLVQRELAAALAGYDALVGAAAPTAAYALGQVVGDPLPMYRGDLMTVNLNLAGLPAISVPCGFEGSEDGSTRLPVGLQIIGRAFQEADIIQIAHCFEQTADFAAGEPPALP